MSHDRQLIDAIKANFARKSAGQLREIAQTTDHERWSPEAIVAAGEVLQDRKAGRAQAPRVAEVEPSPPPCTVDPDSITRGVLGALLDVVLTGGLPIPNFPHVQVEHLEDPDLPVPFGPRMAWLALDTTDTAAVATALGLRGVGPTMWAEGTMAAHGSALFITPPVADWTLAVSTALFPPDQAEPFVKPLLERLSRQFGDAQYFCTHRDIELHVWARAWKGRLFRGYGWLGKNGLTLWNEGTPTKEERDLGFDFSGGAHPDEGCVLQLASLWSMDPTSLNDQYKEPVLGLLGHLDR